MRKSYSLQETSRRTWSGMSSILEKNGPAMYGLGKSHFKQAKIQTSFQEDFEKYLFRNIYKWIYLLIYLFIIIIIFFLQDIMARKCDLQKFSCYLIDQEYRNFCQKQIQTICFRTTLISFWKKLKSTNWKVRRLGISFQACMAAW